MYGTGGQVNRMSDDLISRKALLDRFRYGDKESESDKAWICAVRRMIKEQSTAFDKEKVIEELNDAKDDPHDDSVAEITATRIWNKAIARSIKIVEKSGLE